jgi:shikimate kinase
MGVGKSSVGRAAAQRLGFRFVDTDRMIEGRTGKTVTRIFTQDGESHFRELEHAVVEQLESTHGLVIATGGGLATNQANLDSLKKHALIICLCASPERILPRVRRHTSRPLMQTPDPQEKIRELLEARAPFYRQADVLLNTDTRSMREVIQQVVHHFQEARSRRQ